jgi:branched-chain amino acid transport system substrate-binding protein
VTLRVRALAVLVATAAVAAACTGDAPAPTPTPSFDPVPVKVAFFQDGSVETPNAHGQPSFLGLKLSLSRANESGTLPVLVELVGYDTQGDPDVAAALAREVTADPAYVAAVAAPFWVDTSAVAEVFGAAGIPVLSLSGSAQRDADRWFPIVAGRRAQVAAIAGYVRGRRGGTGACLAGDGSPYGASIGEALEAALRGSLEATVRVDPATGDASAAVTSIEDAACETVVWTGFGTGAGILRAALGEAGEGERLFVGADGMKEATYLELAGAAADGTVVVCPCVDLSASPDAAAQRFVHDFQARYATPPGVYAAEGWDAGEMLVRAFRVGAATPDEVADELVRGERHDGLAAAYSLGEAPEDVPVHLSRAEGGRWVPVATDREELPLATEGVLSVGSCRTGAPYAYRDRAGRLVGFDVELARALARTLGLALGWTRTSCAAGTAPVDEGRTDLLLLPRDRLVPGTPSSGAVFSTRAALVVPASEVSGGRRPPKLGRGDVVGVTGSGAVARWARRSLRADGVRLRRFADPHRAYALLERGRLSAVADAEAAAWATIEHRTTLLVGATHDTGAHDVMVAAGSATELLPAVDEALASMVEEGSYARLFAEYVPGATLPPTIGP